MPVTVQELAEALDPQLVARLSGQARAQGLSLLVRDGLLRQPTKRFLEATLDDQVRGEFAAGLTVAGTDRVHGAHR